MTPFLAVAEAGVPGYNHTSWVGVLAPGNTHRTIIDRLHAEMVRIIQAPEVKALFLRDGPEVVGNTPQEFAAIIKDEIARWKTLARVANLPVE